jgi:hypothetical protein
MELMSWLSEFNISLLYLVLMTSVITSNTGVEMIRNIGKIDRTLRFSLALILVWLGLYVLQGLEGNVFGIIVAAISLIPFATSTTGYCPVFQWVNINSLSKKERDLFGDPSE